MAKRQWLVKSEPGTYSYADLERDGRTVWDGVRNFQARNYLREMSAGDEVLYYHSGDEKAVVALARVARAAYPDPSAPGQDWSVVDLAPLRALSRPVSLAEIKATPALAGMLLLRQSRLSVLPVARAEYDLIVKLASPARDARASS